MLNKLVLFLSIFGWAYGQNAPVFLWGSSSPLKPALKSLSASDFGAILSPSLKDSMLIVFLEKSLQTKDFSQCKLKSGETCFSNLKLYKTKTFYADVEEPVQTVLSLNLNVEEVQIRKDRLPKDIKYEVGKVLFVSFEKSNNDRSQDLIEHDSIMGEVYQMFEKQGSVFAIYTSPESTEQKYRARRDAPIIKKDETGKSFWGTVETDSVLVYFKKITLGEKSVEVTGMTLTKDKATDKIDVKLTTSEGDLTYSAIPYLNYWNINSFNLGSKIFPVDIEAADDFAYYCGNIESVFEEDTKNILILEDFQIEIFYNKTINAATAVFDDPWHCTGFVSPGIVSGLFVSLLFVIIMSIGITWIMDIRTMDRFDDPKGKTITINASD